MEKFLFVLAFFLACGDSYSQEKTTHVMVSSGNTILHPELNLDWVVGESILGHEVLFDLSTSEVPLATPEEADFKVYPTITDDWINVTTQLEDKKDLYLQIYDSSHKQLKVLNWNSTPQKINIESFSAGIYFIKVNQKNKGTLTVLKVVRK